MCRLHMMCILFCLFLGNTLLSCWTLNNPVFIFCCMLGTKKLVPRCWSFLLFAAHIRAVTGVKLNYLSGWKSSYVRGAAANTTAAAHPVCPESHWHEVISAQIRPIFLQYRFYAFFMQSIHLCCSISSLQWVSHSSSVMYDIFLCNMQRSSLEELFLVGVCLVGWRTPGLSRL